MMEYEFIFDGPLQYIVEVVVCTAMVMGWYMYTNEKPPM